MSHDARCELLSRKRFLQMLKSWWLTNSLCSLVDDRALRCTCICFQHAGSCWALRVQKLKRSKKETSTIASVHRRIHRQRFALIEANRRSSYVYRRTIGKALTSIRLTHCILSFCWRLLAGRQTSTDISTANAVKRLKLLQKHLIDPLET